MGYSTMLYAVDIGELKAAFGSKDAALLERVREVASRKEGAVSRVDPTKGPRIRVDWKSEIFLNGKLVTQDEFKHAMLNPEWEGTYIYSYMDSGPPRGRQQEGPFREPGSFYLFMNTLAPFFAEHGRNFVKHYAGDNRCSTPQEFAEIGSGEDDITDEQALEELIAGKITQPEHAATYGYALEHLCEALGTFLGAVGTDQLMSLKLKTSLSRTRVPVKIPKGDVLTKNKRPPQKDIRSSTFMSVRLRGASALKFPAGIDCRNECQIPLQVSNVWEKQSQLQLLEQ
jgi:hypothetical protein